MGKKQPKIRDRKMQTQGGLCFYCDRPMWSGCPEQFCRSHGVSRRKARQFQCTAEHLVANSDGGPVSDVNIVAACRFCNATRHKPTRPLNPRAYKSHVQKRLRMNRWLQL